jgi:hypothetical protein
MRYPPDSPQHDVGTAHAENPDALTDALSRVLGTLAEPEHVITVSEMPRFCANLPSSALRKRLVKLLDVRAMICVVELQTRRTRFRVRNNDSKTVYKVLLDENRLLHRRPLMPRIALVPVRGYKKSSTRYHATLVAQFNLCSVDEALYHEALRRSERRPRGQELTPVSLATTQRSDAAYKSLLRGYSHSVKANMAGIVDDFDTECLHELRIAIRRI